VLLATGEERRSIPGYRVRHVDATGAGDCFAGCFLARLVAGDEPAQAARYANVAAALSTRDFGAVAPIPRPAEVLAALVG
jgi:2-dehydro-3-deoxygluconokinase